MALSSLDTGMGNRHATRPLDAWPVCDALECLAITRRHDPHVWLDRFRGIVAQRGEDTMTAKPIRQTVSATVKASDADLAQDGIDVTARSAGTG
jgi:hypothetical protein